MANRLTACAMWAFALGAVGTIAGGQAGQGLPAAARQKNAPGATREQFERWMKDLTNWGRWGKDDQLGTANLYTPEKHKQALALAKTGTTVSLGHDVADERGSDANNPFVIKMIVSPDPPLVRDRLDLDYHGGFFTHLDAVCHVVYQDRIFNGFDFRQTITQDGCTRLAITGLKNGIVTRAVLIDVPRLRGVPYLEPGTRVYREDIEEWERKAGVKVGAGDALLIRTGRWPRRAKVGAAPGAGMDASFLPFLKDRDIALFGSDTAHELPENIPGLTLTVIHKFTVVARGMNLLDNLDLEAAAETAARLKRWEFMLTVSPLRIPKGTGSPINPIAFF